MARKATFDSSDNPSSASLTENLANDAAGWVQALIMALPALGYGVVYYARWYTFDKLGISNQLISIRLEDILFVIASCLLFYGSSLGNLIILFLSGRDKVETLLRDFIIAIMLLGICYQLSMLITISIKCHIKQPSHYFVLILQIAILIFAQRALKKALQGTVALKEIVRISIILILSFLVIATPQIAYLSFHTRSYQLCTEDNALIIAYDQQGRAVEKSIIIAKEYDVCELSPGYSINDVADKQLKLVNYCYVMSNN